MNFGFAPEIEALRAQVRRFVDEKIIPVEDRILADDAKGDRNLLNGLRAEAKTAGLYTPHLPEAFGGKSLGTMGMCALFREMGRSLVGPKVFNCSASMARSSAARKSCSSAKRLSAFCRGSSSTLP